MYKGKDLRFKFRPFGFRIGWVCQHVFRDALQKRTLITQFRAPYAPLGRVVGNGRKMDIPLSLGSRARGVLLRAAGPSLST